MVHQSLLVLNGNSSAISKETHFLLVKSLMLLFKANSCLYNIAPENKEKLESMVLIYSEE